MDYIFANPDDRCILESILHPLVEQQRDCFLKCQKISGSRIVGLDVPLLFEVGADSLCDYVIVVRAGLKTVRQRALARPGMTKEKLAGILANQMTAADKCKLADFVLDTDLDPKTTRKILFDYIEQIITVSDI